MTKSFIESSLTQEDPSFEIPLRPQTLQEFAGQDQIRERLEVLIGAAKQRGDPLSHCLFTGPPGLGKTTLANILAKVMGTNIVVTSGPMVEKPGDLAGVLTNLKEGDILFIDELHRLNRVVEEYLYPAMEDFRLDLMIDSGPSARTVQVKLNHFTLVGATTRAGLLTAPLRSRFPFTCRLNYYAPQVLETILLRTSRILNLNINVEGAREIAKRARGTPRIANNLLCWVRDYAQMRAGSRIDRSVVIHALEMLDIDEVGLDEMDKKILEVMLQQFEGGPVGLSTISVAVGEEGHTIAEVYEPYLIMKGFIKRTPKGRVVTQLGRQHVEQKQKV
ncbi:MAG: Holliday junction ATP-dependent DNA helicase RuvB [Chlamydiae bacterium]|nr:Holliday junction ATP-dependent DNA helicase RuvB [Chlamydiota bacterium]